MIRLSLRVAREQAEIALAELLELVPDGVEEVDRGDGTVEYAIYGPPGEVPALPDLRAAAGETLVEVRTEEVPDDWQERWKRFHSPILLEAPEGSRLPHLHVRPPWLPRSDRAGAVEVVIDPGQAFGTGSHATTRLCLQLLLELAAGGGAGPLIDVGTGSGVLAIAAAKLGFEPVTGLDIERESVAAAEQNAKANGVRLRAARLDIRADPLPDVRGSVTLANLLRPLLLDLSRRLASAPPHLIASGLLTDEAEEISDAFGARLGMIERRRCEQGEWAAIWLSRQGPAGAAL